MTNSNATRRLYIGVAVAALALAVTAALSARWTKPPASKAATATATAVQELGGDFTLWAASPQADPCKARSEAPDIHAGAPVDVRDGGGATIAAATLAEGRPDPTHRGCVYGFTVTQVPAADTYTVQVGSRVGPTYPHAEVVKAGWRVALNLGLPDPAAG